LNLLNDPVFFEAAQALAVRVLRESPAGFAPRLNRAFALTVARPPSARESERMARLFDQQLGILAGDAGAVPQLMPVEVEGVARVEAAAWAALCRVLLNLDEFITRE